MYLGSPEQGQLNYLCMDCSHVFSKDYGHCSKCKTLNYIWFRESEVEELNLPIKEINLPTEQPKELE